MALVLMLTLIVVLIPIALLNELNAIAALILVRGADFLSIFEKPQRLPPSCPSPPSPSGHPGGPTGGTDESSARSQAGSTGLAAPSQARPMPAAPVRQPLSSTQP